MVTNRHSRDSSIIGQNINWIEYYPALFSLARRFVYLYHLPIWRGQEEDLVKDIAQETVKRLIERLQKVERGETAPIIFIERMMMVIARNYVLDLRRRDYRMIHLADASVLEANANAKGDESVLERVTEHLYHQWLFLQIAQGIAQLPRKQRKAILIDLANRTSFGVEPTPLETALSSVNIDLQDYQQPLPENPVERARYASLVSLAYKRVTRAANAQHIISAE